MSMKDNTYIKNKRYIIFPVDKYCYFKRGNNKLTSRQRTGFWRGKPLLSTRQVQVKYRKQSSVKLLFKPQQPTRVKLFRLSRLNLLDTDPATIPVDNMLSPKLIFKKLKFEYKTVVFLAGARNVCSRSRLEN